MRLLLLGQNLLDSTDRRESRSYIRIGLEDLQLPNTKRNEIQSLFLTQESRQIS